MPQKRAGSGITPKLGGNVIDQANSLGLQDKLLTTGNQSGEHVDKETSSLRTKHVKECHGSWRNGLPVFAAQSLDMSKVAPCYRAFHTDQPLPMRQICSNFLAQAKPG